MNLANLSMFSNHALVMLVNAGVRGCCREVYVAFSPPPNKACSVDPFPPISDSTMALTTILFWKLLSTLETKASLYPFTRASDSSLC